MQVLVIQKSLQHISISNLSFDIFLTGKLSHSRRPCTTAWQRRVSCATWPQAGGEGEEDAADNCNDAIKNADEN